MPIADFEKAVLRLLAANRNPESFVAGATVLLRDEHSPRRSRDIDLFHDTAESIKAAAEADAATLEKNGYAVAWDLVEPTFRRALVERRGTTTKLEWVFDSAFRFFPVEPDAELGYALNFWDAATNKVLALAGRGELRDYLDVLHLDQRHLSLGALAWAACGKDTGYTPQFLLEEAQRLARYPASRLAELDLREPVDLVACKRRWLEMTHEAFALFDRLPAGELGCLYLDLHNRPVTPDPVSSEFPNLCRHFGSVRGTWPVIAN
jgi:Nucleotidyl transferase AbiEii toxin, Type IV TA system